LKLRRNRHQTRRPRSVEQAREPLAAPVLNSYRHRRIVDEALQLRREARIVAVTSS
jgi:hypothetical protein